MRKDMDIHKRDVTMARLEAEISRRILDLRLSGPEALVVLTNLAGQVAREITRMERQVGLERRENLEMATAETVDPITPVSQAVPMPWDRLPGGAESPEEVDMRWDEITGQRRIITPDPVPEEEAYPDVSGGGVPYPNANVPEPGWPGPGYPPRPDSWRP